MIYIELFWTFFVIGMFTIGGGYAMLSLIQSKVVTEHAWIDESMFTDIIAISQMTPGPIGINSATYIGYEVLAHSGASEFMCVLGSFTATFAVVLPSFMIVLWICILYKKFRNNRRFSIVLSTLRPVTIGMIAAAAIILITPHNFIDIYSWLLFIGAFILAMFFKIGPIQIIIASGIVGYLIY